MKLQRFRVTLAEELGPWRPDVRIPSWLIGLLPSIAFIRTRTRLLRLAGWSIGPDTALFDVPRLYGRGAVRRRLRIGARVRINVGCVIELNDDVEIGDDAALGADVVVLTSTHRLGPRSRRAGQLDTRAVRIGRGSWIGSRVTILPGVEIGDGAVVMAGSVVNDDVSASSLVGGVPAIVQVPRLPG